MRRLGRGPVAAAVALWMAVALLASLGGLGARTLRVVVWLAIVTMVIGVIAALGRRFEPEARGPRALEDRSEEPRRRERVH